MDISDSDGDSSISLIYRGKTLRPITPSLSSMLKDQS